MKIGHRVAFLLAKGKFSDDVSDDNVSFDFSLVPIMFGGSYNRNISEKFSLNGKLFFGYGLIKHKAKKVWRDELGERREKTFLDIDGGCFVADISIGAQYWLTKRLGLGLDLGYRFTPETEIEGKKIWQKRKVDFSGLTTKLSLSYKI
ncbi:hypothetical protein [Candidatus Endomicrobiellum pyrsonymphae]|uniref:hypothetical protein n=1 Tax=Candidatus Endomicrobiellum pyrsonymphae TaxID=1408203 RepID=UPI0035A924CD